MSTLQIRFLKSFQWIGWLFFSVACSTIFWFPSIAFADELLHEIAETIHKNHISRPPKSVILTKPIKGINKFIQTLDPHSRYLSKEEYRRFKADEAGGHCGIGAEVSLDKKGFVLIPIQGGPANKAGIHQRQYLKSVNGRMTQDMNLGEIKSAVYGPKGSTVSLGISNYHSGKYREVMIPRERFVSPSVEVISGTNMEYIRILQFIARRTVARLRVSIKNMIQKGQPIILDFRDSSGGDLYEAIDALSLFLPQGTRIGSVENSEGENRLFYALPNQQVVYARVLTLVGPMTASAAELFVSVLKHYARTMIIGQKTYGKCTSQKYFKMRDGSALKLTNLKINYPDGKHCNGVGVIPDINATDKELYQTDKLISEGLRKF